MKYSTVVEVLLSFTYSLSLTSFLEIFFYQQIISNTYLIHIFFALFFIIFILLFRKHQDDFSDITFRQIAISATFLAPFITFLLISPLPLGDDIRYIAYSLFYPNGFYSLVGFSTQTLSHIFNVNIIVAYWINVFIMYYLIFVLFSLFYKRVLKLKHHLLATFLTVYIPNILLFLLLPKLIVDPNSINDLIFYKFQYHYLGRNIALDPNPLKNYPIMFGLVSLLLSPRMSSYIIFPISFILSYFYHPQNALTMYFFVFLYLLNIKKSYRISYIYVILSTVTYVLVLISPYYWQVALFYSNNSFVRFFASTIFIISLFLIPFLLRSLSDINIINKNIYKIYVVLMFLIFIAGMYLNIPIEPELRREISVKTIVFYGLYLYVFFLAVYRYCSDIYKNNQIFIIFKMSFYAFAYILFVIVVANSLPYLLPYFVPNLGELGIARYIQVVTRLLTIAPTSYILYIPPIAGILYFYEKCRRVFPNLILNLLLVFSIFSLLFYVLYWGYYYRNPWANAGLNATDINHILLATANLSLPVTPWIHTMASVESIAVADIISLKTGLLSYTPASIQNKEIPLYLKNVMMFAPSIIIADYSYRNLLEFKPNITINFDKTKVDIYFISNASKDLPISVLIGPPLVDPKLNAKYYSDIIKLQISNPSTKIVILPSQNFVDPNMKIIGYVKFNHMTLLKNNTVNLTNLTRKDYKYLIIISSNTTVYLKMLCGDKTIKINAYNFYPFYYYIVNSSVFFISVSQLMNLTANKCTYLTFLDIKSLYAVENYKIILREN